MRKSSIATKDRLVEWNDAMVRKSDEPIRGCASCGRAKRTTEERSFIGDFLALRDTTTRLAISTCVST